jgi:hypothetical protein
MRTNLDKQFPCNNMILQIFAIFLAVVLTACNKPENLIVGTWDYDPSSANAAQATKYTGEPPESQLFNEYEDQSKWNLTFLANKSVTVVTESAERSCRYSLQKQGKSLIIKSTSGYPIKRQEFEIVKLDKTEIRLKWKSVFAMGRSPRPGVTPDRVELEQTSRFVRRQ